MGVRPSWHHLTRPLPSAVIPMQSPTWSGAPAAARPLPGGAALPAQPRAQETPTWLPALARPRPPLNDAEAPGRRAIPNWSACPAPSPRQLPTPDTVNAPEFPIMYLFWVFILCTEMAAHMCFLRKRKKKNPQWKRRNYSTAFLVLCCACMCP